MPYITLTGADDSTSLDDLWSLAAQYRFGLVEWGVLYSVANQGEGRYPSFDWVERLAFRLASAGVRHPSFALHVCGGRAVGDFLAGGGHVSAVAKKFNRVQLNFRHDSYPLDLLRAAMQRNLGAQVITQHNNANADLWALLAEHGNHAVLFDASGGRGIAPDMWPAPLDGVECGYAGGLGSGNLAAELPRIHGAAAGKPYWIDMKSNLRNAADRFDLSLAKQCLDITSEFYQRNILTPAVTELSKPLPVVVADVFNV